VLRRKAEAQETPSPIRPDPSAKRGGPCATPFTTRRPTSTCISPVPWPISGPEPDVRHLLRRDPKDGQTIIPDLAWKYEISPDGKKYTFHLRKGVKFHDGADFTAEDVKATYDRIVRPPKGVVIRAPALRHGERDRGGRPAQDRVPHVGGATQGLHARLLRERWNIIVRKKTLEENQGNLRQVMNYPGTGPFKHVSRQDKEVWIMDRNPNYWNKGLPYIDKLEVYHMFPFSPELGSAFISGKVDYARLLDPVSWRKAKEMPGVTAAAFIRA